MKHSAKFLLHNFLLNYFPKMVISRKWKRKFGYPIDWKQPRDINEKIQWLLVNSDTSEWTRLADKVKVRDFIKERGLADLLVPIYGVWNDPNEICYEDLPQKFILKCNHDSSSTKLVDKSEGYDKETLTVFFNTKLIRDYGVDGELHYSKIQPRCIIAEQYLEQDDNSLSSSLIDYKVWCFNGKPFCVMTCHNRTKESVCLNVYDLDWNVHPEYCLFNDRYRDGKGIIPQPSCFNEMIKAASTLSKGFPEVRIDFYEVNNQLFFGEMTFTSMCGMMQYYTPEFLKLLGNQVILPITSPNKRY